MLKLDMIISDEFIDAVAQKIADRATEVILERSKSMKTDLPPILTRDEAMEVLKCGSTTMSELMRRPDFPVIREFGVKIPTHMLMKWIERNTNWIEKNTNYFEQEAI
ncbi:hypothetical protein NST02_23580 [Robertmurraya sp. FSL W8-0741]|uniref:hypothetical protein n=1 Tax=Robertmurraya sp. FSL W8-0741 TaxID=2954629 RepID=UPI0030FBA71C